MECEQPMFALSHGLLRTLRCENTSVRYVSLDLDSFRRPWAMDDIRVITAVYKSNFGSSNNQRILDLEYAERNGVIKIPRVLGNFQSDDRAGQSPEDGLNMELFYQPNERLDLEARTQSSRGFVFRKISTKSAPLPNDWVEIAPEAFGVNHGESPSVAVPESDSSLGYGLVGRVTKLGCGVSNVALGQRICSMAQGPLSSRIRVPCTQTSPIPDDWELGIGATIPTAFVTAYGALHDFARIQKEETVLIHAATRDIGRAAIMLARSAKARILATASNPQECKTLIAEMGIPEEHVFLTRDGSFASDILAFNHDKGVDVIFTPLSGKTTAESWKCIAPLGRFCQIGKRDVASNRGMEMGPFADMASFMVIDPSQLALHRPRDFQRVLSACVDLISHRGHEVLGPVMEVPISKLDQVEGVLKVAGRAGKGSVVITAKAEDKVKVNCSPHLQIPHE